MTSNPQSEIRNPQSKASSVSTGDKMFLSNSHRRPRGSGRIAARRGFTLVELLVAMAAIVFIMSILSEAFVEGLDTLRDLKALGDMQEQLRGAAAPLRSKVLLGHFQTEEFIDDTLRTGSPNPAKIADLRALYVSISDDAESLEGPLRDLRGQTTDRVVRRQFDLALKNLFAIKYRAERMVELLDLINPPSPPTDF
jgi:prepilin-type N-terminal cleavage/methylation domain-containing protein